MSSGSQPQVGPHVDAGGQPTSAPVVFRLPKVAYGIVGLLLFCVIPFAFTAGAGSLRSNTTSHATLSWRVVFVIVPLLVAIYIGRTATYVDAAGIRVRAVFGQRRLGWDEIRGLSINEHNVVYAVVSDGMVRLPCVRFNDLAIVSAASGGRLPEVARPKLKFALSRRPRGRR